MTFAIQQAPMHRAMDEVLGEGAHHDGSNRGADKSDHVEHAIVPWFKPRTHSNPASAQALSKLRWLEAGRTESACPMRWQDLCWHAILSAARRGCRRHLIR